MDEHIEDDDDSDDDRADAAADGDDDEAPEKDRDVDDSRVEGAPLSSIMLSKPAFSSSPLSSVPHSS